MGRKWMRRSQKRKMGWVGFMEYLERYPLSKLKTAHSFCACYILGELD